MTIRTPSGTPQTHNRKPSVAQFIGSFSDTAWDSIKASNSKKLSKWLDQVKTMGIVDLDDEIITDGIAALESNSVIDSAEAIKVLAGVEL